MSRASHHEVLECRTIAYAPPSHEEEWDGKPNTTGEDGFMGKLNEFRKKITAGAIHSAVDTTPPKEK